MNVVVESPSRTATTSALLCTRAWSRRSPCAATSLAVSASWTARWRRASRRNQVNQPAQTTTNRPSSSRSTRAVDGTPLALGLQPGSRHALAQRRPDGGVGQVAAPGEVGDRLRARRLDGEQPAHLVLEPRARRTVGADAGQQCVDPGDGHPAILDGVAEVVHPDDEDQLGDEDHEDGRQPYETGPAAALLRDARRVEASGRRRRRSSHGSVIGTTTGPLEDDWTGP